MQPLLGLFRLAGTECQIHRFIWKTFLKPWYQTDGADATKYLR